MSEPITLSYYREVDASQIQAFEGMDTADLRRLGSSLSGSPPATRPSTAYIHYSLFLQTGQLKDLDEAILRAGDSLPPERDADYADRLKDLVTLHVKKFQLTGSVTVDLHSAIFRAHEMVGITPQNHLDWPARVKDWIALMLIRAERSGSPEDLNEASFAAEQAGATVELSPARDGGMAVRVVIPGYAHLTQRFSRTEATKASDTLE